MQECAYDCLADELITAFDETAHQVVFSASGQSHAASDYFMNQLLNQLFLEVGALMRMGVLSSQRRRLKIKLVLYMILTLFFHIFHVRISVRIWCAFSA